MTITFVKSHRIPLLITFLAILCGWLIFYGITTAGLSSDVPLHSMLLGEHLDQNTFPIPPLYYFVLYVFSGLTSDPATLNQTAAIILACAVGGKFWTTNTVLLDGEVRSKTKTRMSAIAGLLLLFSAPLFYDMVSKQMYLGKLATNVWHNSTTIFVMPFVVYMFYTSNKILTTEGTAKKNFGIILLMGILTLLIKPSFLFAFIPVFSALALSTFGWRSKKFRWALTCAVILFLGIFVQYYMIYLQDPSGISFNKNQSGIAIAPFAFWNIYSRNIPLDMLASIAYPLMACVLFGKELFRKKYFLYSLLLFVVALSIGILFTETGERADNGNLFWQVIMCNY